jgi:hypothetical protein
MAAINENEIVALVDRLLEQAVSTEARER